MNIAPSPMNAITFLRVCGIQIAEDGTVTVLGKIRVHGHLQQLFRKPSSASQDSDRPQRVEQRLFFE